MRVLVDTSVNIGSSGSNLKIYLLPEPVREIRVYLTSINCNYDDAVEICDKIIGAASFAKNDPDPWSNPYE